MRKMLVANSFPPRGYRGPEPASEARTEDENYDDDDGDDDNNYDDDNDDEDADDDDDDDDDDADDDLELWEEERWTSSSGLRSSISKPFAIIMFTIIMVFNCDDVVS